tara:strand:+ start:606 stop:1193 length:588 start_codon:yes stop_codon:yes gene_type:complete
MKINPTICTKLLNFKYLSLSIFLFLTFACGIYAPSDARKVSPNVEDRVAKAIEEGKGFQLNKIGKGKGSGTFEFASSNPLWRASMEVLDFLPLTNVDYSGGIIITDWYNEGTINNESIKITVRFLSNEIRADGLLVIIHRRICNKQLDCKVLKIKSSLEEEIKIAILKKATIFQKYDTEQKVKEYKKKYGDYKVQ